MKCLQFLTGINFYVLIVNVIYSTCTLKQLSKQIEM